VRPPLVSDLLSGHLCWFYLLLWSVWLVYFVACEWILIRGGCCCPSYDPWIDSGLLLRGWFCTDFVNWLLSDPWLPIWTDFSWFPLMTGCLALTPDLWLFLCVLSCLLVKPFTIYCGWWCLILVLCCIVSYCLIMPIVVLLCSIRWLFRLAYFNFGWIFGLCGWDDLNLVLGYRT
jgi:hypothetical protein